MKTPFGTELSGDTARSKRRRWLPIALGGIVLTLLVGAAAAASIQINSGDPIEFGQGKEIATVCDDSIDASMYTTTYGADLATLGFRIWYVSLRNVNLTACSDKVFTVTLRKTDGSAAGVCAALNADGDLDTGCTSPSYNDAGTATIKFSFTGCDGYAVCTITYYGNSNDNGIADIYTNRVTDIATDGSIELWPVWNGNDTKYPALGTKYYLVRADQVAGFTVETSG